VKISYRHQPKLKKKDKSIQSTTSTIDSTLEYSDQLYTIDYKVY